MSELVDIEREIDLATANRRKAIEAFTDAEFVLKEANKRHDAALRARAQAQQQHEGEGRG